MNVLVLGAEGMLGHKVYQVLGERLPGVAGTIYGALSDPFYRRVDLFHRGEIIERVDAMDFPALRALILERRPAHLVNCIGIIKQRDEASLPIPSIALNSLLPHLLADWASTYGGRVFHFSTDCVFSGERGGYTEDDPPDARDLYGRTKFLGEVRAAGALTLRTSIIGRELREFRSLLEWFLSQEGGTVRGFRRHIYSGVTTPYMARLVARLIEEHPDLSGLYQVTGRTIDKHALLCKLRDAFHLDVEVVPDDSTRCDRSMVGDRFVRATGIEPPPWDELVAELAADPTPYRRWRG